MEISLDDILPNPFRDFKSYPIFDKRVDALVTSMTSSGFWENFAVRPHPDQPGKYQQDVGHHRLRAARKCGIQKADLPVQNLSDEMMLQRFVNENLEEWGHDAGVAFVTLEAIVRAHGKSQILSVISDHASARSGGGLRIAPSFIPRREHLCLDTNVRAYSIETLCKFLPAMPEYRIRAGISALALRELKVMDITVFFNLNSYEAINVVVEVNRVRDQTEDNKLARRIGNHLAEGMKDHSITVKTARAVADRMMREARIGTEPGKPKEQPEIVVALTKLAEKLDKMFISDSSLYIELTSALAVLNDLLPGDRDHSREAQQYVIRALDGITCRISEMAEGFTKLSEPQPEPQPNTNVLQRAQLFRPT